MNLSLFLTIHISMIFIYLYLLAKSISNSMIIHEVAIIFISDLFIAYISLFNFKLLIINIRVLAENYWKFILQQLPIFLKII
jgi:hypothetical protein